MFRIQKITSYFLTPIDFKHLLAEDKELTSI